VNRSGIGASYREIRSWLELIIPDSQRKDLAKLFNAGRERSFRTLQLFPVHVVKVVQQGTAQMAQHKPEDRYEYVLDSWRHSRGEYPLGKGKCKKIRPDLLVLSGLPQPRQMRN
jgi:hypothetical protein